MESFVEPKKKFILPKNLLFLGVIFIAIFAMIGGIILMGDSTKKPTQQMQRLPMSLEVPDTNNSSKNDTPTIPVPTTDPTSTWLSYTNKSFSFKYPSRYTLAENKTPFSTLYPKIYTTITLTDGVNTIAITAAKNTPNYTSDTVIGNGPTLRYARTLLSENSIKIITIDNSNAFRIEKIPAGKNGTAVDLLLVKNEKVYQLSLYPIDADPVVFDLLLGTFGTINQEPKDATDTWQVQVDNVYKYSFRYPFGYEVDFGKTASGSPSLTMVYDDNLTSTAPKFKVEAQDPLNFGQSAKASKELLKLPLDDYVDQKWESNKEATDTAYPNRKVGAVVQTFIDGNEAYYFTVTDKYQDENVSEKLSEEYIFYFTENNGYKFKIWFPKSNPTYLQILSTFIWL